MMICRKKALKNACKQIKQGFVYLTAAKPRGAEADTQVDVSFVDARCRFALMSFLRNVAVDILVYNTLDQLSQLF